MVKRPPQPYSIVVVGSSLTMRTGSLAVAVREAEKLSQRMKAEARVYHGALLVQTFRAASV